jgi:hypothetical protein
MMPMTGPMGLPLNAIMMSALGVVPPAVQPHVSPQTSTITNPSNFLERHRNATVRSCYAPVDAPVDAGADRIYRIRQVRDSGIETIATSTRRGVNPQSAPQPVVNGGILNSVVPRHLAPSVYRAFPRATFEASAGSVACCSCLLDFDEGDIVVTTPCMHRLHEDCGDGWFLSESHTCPQCRASCGITVNEEAAGEQAAARGRGVLQMPGIFSNSGQNEAVPPRRRGRGLVLPQGYSEPPQLDAAMPQRRGRVGRGLRIPLVGYDELDAAVAAASAPPTNPVEALLLGRNNPN